MFHHMCEPPSIPLSFHLAAVFLRQSNTAGATLFGVAVWCHQRGLPVSASQTPLQLLQLCCIMINALRAVHALLR